MPFPLSRITTNRLEAFSDNVISILITLMVFDIKVPAFGKVLQEGEVWRSLVVLAPNFTAYLFSFCVMGVLWANHHNMMHIVQKVDGSLLWLNLLFLFWMSLIPFPTSMVGANHHLPASATLFAAVLFMTSLAFTLLRRYALRSGLMQQKEPDKNRQVRQLGQRILQRGYVGTLIYLAAIPCAFVSVYLTYGLILLPTALFFVPAHIDNRGKQDDAVESEAEEEPGIADSENAN